MNKALIIGRLGQDPETRYTQGGDAVTNFSVATSEKYKDRSGETVEKTEWHKVVAWRRLAEICGQYLKKGSQVYVEGKIQTRSWEDGTGKKRYTTEIVAQSVEFLSGQMGREGWESNPEDDSQVSKENDESIPF